MTKISLGFRAISNRIRKLDIPDVDVVVGIATGGIIPASIIAFHIQKELEIIQFNFRDENNVPRYESPRLINEFNRDYSNKKILLVDDVSVSGKTMEAAKKLFSSGFVITCVMKGSADLSAFPEISECIEWPWKAKC